LSSQFYAIITDGIDDTQHRQVQAAVESKSDAWWHQLENIWIVEGSLSAADWIDLIAVIFPYMPSKVLVLRLPDDGPGRWAAKFNPDDGEWLKEHFPTTGPDRPPSPYPYALPTPYLTPALSGTPPIAPPRRDPSPAAPPRRDPPPAAPPRSDQRVNGAPSTVE
jgi:hypothetical protein